MLSPSRTSARHAMPGRGRLADRQPAGIGLQPLHGEAAGAGDRERGREITADHLSCHALDDRPFDRGVGPGPGVGRHGAAPAKHCLDHRRCHAGVEHGQATPTPRLDAQQSDREARSDAVLELQQPQGTRRTDTHLGLWPKHGPDPARQRGVEAAEHGLQHRQPVETWQTARRQDSQPGAVRRAGCTRRARWRFGKFAHGVTPGPGW